MAVSLTREAPRGETGDIQRRILGRRRRARVLIYVKIERYLLIEAARLEILADVASAKGHTALAENIRRCRRILVDAVPLKPALGSAAGASDDKVPGFSL
jgi:hypothetical protein